MRGDVRGWLVVRKGASMNNSNVKSARRTERICAGKEALADQKLIEKDEIIDRQAENIADLLILNDLRSEQVELHAYMARHWRLKLGNERRRAEEMVGQFNDLLRQLERIKREAQQVDDDKCRLIRENTALEFELSIERGI